MEVPGVRPPCLPPETWPLASPLVPAGGSARRLVSSPVGAGAPGIPSASPSSCFHAGRTLRPASEPFASPSSPRSCSITFPSKDISLLSHSRQREASPPVLVSEPEAPRADAKLITGGTSRGLRRPAAGGRSAGYTSGWAQQQVLHRDHARHKVQVSTCVRSRLRVGSVAVTSHDVGNELPVRLELPHQPCISV